MFFVFYNISPGGVDVNYFGDFWPISNNVTIMQKVYGCFLGDFWEIGQLFILSSGHTGS